MTLKRHQSSERHGYINRIASSRRLERETQRNIELMWLTGRLAPDFKTIADFRKDNGPAIRATCRRFIDLCRRLDLFFHAAGAAWSATTSRPPSTPSFVRIRIVVGRQIKSAGAIVSG